MGLRDHFKKLSNSHPPEHGNSQDANHSYNPCTSSNSSSSFNSNFNRDDNLEKIRSSEKVPEFDTKFKIYAPGDDEEFYNFSSSFSKLDVKDQKDGYSNENYSANFDSGPSSRDNYGPPPGPPPGAPSSSFGNSNISNNLNQFANHTAPRVFGAPPPGPPPGFKGFENESEPPPSYRFIDSQSQALPPSYSNSSASEFRALYSEAPEAELEMGDTYTDLFPIYPPRFITFDQFKEMDNRQVELVSPPNLFLNDMPPNLIFSNRFKGGKIRYVYSKDGSQKDSSGSDIVSTHVETKKNTPDITFISNLPLFSVHLKQKNLFPTVYYDKPSGLRNHSIPNTIYFEILITSISNPQDNVVSLGYVCLPYPEFRQPGWHRGSIAVHSDDGRRFVNDSTGGKEFVPGFGQTGAVVGIGINLERMVAFFTRQGKRVKEWSLIEDKNSQPVDAQRNYKDGGIQGLEGDKDIYAAVGIFGKVGVQVNLNGPFKYEEIYRK